jgi:hypothetical protein
MTSYQASERTSKFYKSATIGIDLFGPPFLKREEWAHLYDTVRDDSPQADSRHVLILVLFPPVTDVGAESQELKDHVEDGDKDGGDEKDRISLSMNTTNRSDVSFRKKQRAEDDEEKGKDVLRRASS